MGGWVGWDWRRAGREDQNGALMKLIEPLLGRIEVDMDM